MKSLSGGTLTEKGEMVTQCKHHVHALQKYASGEGEWRRLEKSSALGEWGGLGGGGGGGGCLGGWVVVGFVGGGGGGVGVCLGLFGGGFFVFCCGGGWGGGVWGGGFEKSYHGKRHECGEEEGLLLSATTRLLGLVVKEFPPGLDLSRSWRGNFGRTGHSA